MLRYSSPILTFSLLLTLVAVSQPSSTAWEWRYLKKIEANRTSGGIHFNQTISDLSDPLSLAIPIAYLTTGFVTKDSLVKTRGLTLLSSFAINVGFTYTLKKTFNRPRPAESDPSFTVLTPASSRSFPSGHTSEAFSLATTLSILHPKWYIIIPSYTFASLVGYSRIYLGAHYPSDVIAGALVGMGAAWLNHQVIKQWHLHKRRLAAR
jgi:membrane-associated phospholipid phosphatase